MGVPQKTEIEIPNNPEIHFWEFAQRKQNQFEKIYALLCLSHYLQ